MGHRSAAASASINFTGGWAVFPQVRVICDTPLLCRNGRWTYHKTFSPSDSHTILFFPYRTKPYRDIPTGTPYWRVEWRWGIGKLRFLTTVGHITPFLNLGTNNNNTVDNWMDDWWSVECRQQISTVEYVDNSKRWLRYMSWRSRRREQNRIYLYALVNLKPK